MSACRSCGAEILWAVTENGKRIPLDADPSIVKTPGAFELRGDDPPLAIAARSRRVFVSHFATCPHAAQHRKGKE